MRDFPEIYQLYKSTRPLQIDLDYEVTAAAEHIPSLLEQTCGLTNVNLPPKLKVKLMSQIAPRFW